MSYESRKRKFLKLLKKDGWNIYTGNTVGDFMHIFDVKDFPYNFSDHLCFRSFPHVGTLGIRFMPYDLSIGSFGPHKDGGEQYRRHGILYLILTDNAPCVANPLGESALVMTLDDALQGLKTVYGRDGTGKTEFYEQIANAIAFQKGVTDASRT